MLQTAVTRRVPAPQDIVWQQIGLTTSFFDTLPAADVEIGSDGRSASYTARIGVGPMGWSRSGTAAVAEATRPSRMVIDSALDNQSLVVRSTFELAEGGPDETVLSYKAEVTLAHGMPRLRRILVGILEDHVLDFVDQAATVAERRWKAEQAMGSQ